MKWICCNFFCPLWHLATHTPVRKGFTLKKTQSQTKLQHSEVQNLEKSRKTSCSRHFSIFFSFSPCSCSYSSSATPHKEDSPLLPLQPSLRQKRSWKTTWPSSSPLLCPAVRSRSPFFWSGTLLSKERGGGVSCQGERRRRRWRSACARWTCLACATSNRTSGESRSWSAHSSPRDTGISTPSDWGEKSKATRPTSPFFLLELNKGRRQKLLSGFFQSVSQLLYLDHCRRTFGVWNAFGLNLKFLFVQSNLAAKHKTFRDHET